jgi:hypothetical protein
MTDRPTLEIVSDDCAYIVRDDKQFELSGGGAARIIRNYRHCLTHEGTGERDATAYLWGVMDGIRHENQKMMEDFRASTTKGPPQ